MKQSPSSPASSRPMAVGSMTLLWMLVLLAAAWLLWSGIWEPLLLGLGVVSCLLTIWLIRRMARAAESRSNYRITFPFLLRSVGYLGWLLVEIVKSNLAVARIILSPKLPTAPRLLRLTSSQTTDLGKAIYANSITLTPGTLTLDLRGNQLLIHALTEEMAEDLLDGEMDRRVRRLEGDS